MGQVASDEVGERFNQLAVLLVVRSVTHTIAVAIDLSRVEGRRTVADVVENAVTINSQRLYRPRSPMIYPGSSSSCRRGLRPPNPTPVGATGSFGSPGVLAVPAVQRVPPPPGVPEVQGHPEPWSPGSPGPPCTFQRSCRVSQRSNGFVPNRKVDGHASRREAAGVDIGSGGSGRPRPRSLPLVRTINSGSNT